MIPLHAEYGLLGLPVRGLIETHRGSRFQVWPLIIRVVRFVI
jgi:hypothetical protein